MASRAVATNAVQPKPARGAVGVATARPRAPVTTSGFETKKGRHPREVFSGDRPRGVTDTTCTTIGTSTAFATRKQVTTTAAITPRCPRLVIDDAAAPGRLRASPAASGNHRVTVQAAGTTDPSALVTKLRDENVVKTLAEKNRAPRRTRREAANRLASSAGTDPTIAPRTPVSPARRLRRRTMKVTRQGRLDQDGTTKAVPTRLRLRRRARCPRPFPPGVMKSGVEAGATVRPGGAAKVPSSPPLKNTSWSSTSRRHP